MRGALRRVSVSRDGRTHMMSVLRQGLELARDLVDAHIMVAQRGEGKSGC